MRPSVRPSRARPEVAAIVFVVAGVLGGVLGMVDPVRAERPAEAAPTRRFADPAFDPDAARPPSHGPVYDARRAYLQRDADAARAVLASTRGAPIEGDVEIARFVAARALERAGVPTEAAAEHDALSGAGHVLAGPAAHRRAIAALEAGSAAEALASASRLHADPTLAAQGVLLSIDASIALGRVDEAIDLARRHAGSLEAPATLAIASRLGRALALKAATVTVDDAARAVALRREAARWLRAVAWRASGAESTEARALLEQTVGDLPQPERETALAPTFAEREARAEQLFRAYRHREAEAAFAELAQSAGADRAAACRVRVRHAQAVLNRRDRTRAAELFAPIAAECEREPRATARYHLVRLAADRGDVPSARATAELMADEDGRSPLADDARFLAASAALDAGDVNGARASLDGFESRFADGDMVGDALFERGWLEMRAGRLEAALAAFEALESARPRENRDHAGGRATYWRGRMLAALGRAAQAADAFERVAREHPLTFYALLATSRLGELDDGRRTRLLASLRASFVETPLRFAPRAEMNELSFRRAVALSRAGFPEEARRELAALGCFEPGADAELLWLGAAIVDRAGNPAVAHRLVRRRMQSLEHTWPEGRTIALWRIAYPRVYSSEIESAANAESLDPALLLAIAREESAFDPAALSVAHAVGLTQLMPATAERFARRIGVAHDRAALLTPAINARIGARYLAFLRDRLAPSPALVPSGYNAGEGSVDRWLVARGQMPLDEFVEEIPYEETRRYTKRVLASWAAYRWLWGQGDTATLPVLAQPLPAPRAR